MVSKFIEAQRDCIDQVTDEISNGKKIGHWMWFIFPQISGLGSSEYSIRYSIKNLQEAQEYLSNEILADRLEKLTNIILLNKFDLICLFGEIDYLKFISCMTLFSKVAGKDSVFSKVIEEYGVIDEKTVKILLEIDDGWNFGN